MPCMRTPAYFHQLTYFINVPDMPILLSSATFSISISTAGWPTLDAITDYRGLHAKIVKLDALLKRT